MTQSPPPPQEPPQQPQAAPPPSTSDYMLPHLLGLLAMFWGPLVWWLIKRDDADPMVRAHAVEALNWQISAIIYMATIGVITCGVGAGVVGIMHLIVSIMAVVAANRGEFYQYPLCLRLVK